VIAEEGEEVEEGRGEEWWDDSLASTPPPHLEPSFTLLPAHMEDRGRFPRSFLLDWEAGACLERGFSDGEEEEREMEEMLEREVEEMVEEHTCEECTEIPFNAF